MRRGELVWGVKSSFVAYVRRAAGRITAADGAWIDGDSRFHFPFDPIGSGSDAIRFGGAVELLAHDGLLAVTVADPGVEQIAGRTVLTARLEAARPERSAIAELRDRPAGAFDRGLRWRGVDTRLTPEGADALDPLHYFAGQRVDDLDLTLTEPSDPSEPSDHPRPTR